MKLNRLFSMLMLLLALGVVVGTTTGCQQGEEDHRGDKIDPDLYPEPIKE